MNIYTWIAAILLADILLILFVRGADGRRNKRTRCNELEAQQ